MIAVNQHSSGGREVLDRDGIRVWRADVPGSTDRYVAVFNVSDRPRDVTLGWREIGVPFTRARVRDLWRKTDLEATTRLRVTLRPHASALYRVSGE